MGSDLQQKSSILRQFYYENVKQSWVQFTYVSEPSNPPANFIENLLELVPACFEYSKTVTYNEEALHSHAQTKEARRHLINFSFGLAVFQLMKYCKYNQRTAIPIM